MSEFRPAKLKAADASAYLLEMHSIHRTQKTLAKLRSRGGGPAFYKAGAHVLYDRRDLDEWAVATLGPALRSTSEHTASAA